MQSTHAHKQEAWMPRSITRALLAVALLAAVSAPAFAGSENRKGTAGAEEMNIPVGPRGTALGGTIASDVTGVEAAFWNPAGLATVTGTDALFSHTNYFADMKVNYAGIATKAGGFGVIGINAKILSIGDVIVTTEQAPDGTGEILTPTFSQLGLSWARQFTDRVNFGGTFSYVNENVVDNSASGLAVDLGVQYATDWHGFRLGMVMKNFGTSMSFDGPGFETTTHAPGSDPNANPRVLSFSATKFEMPSYFVLGTSYELYRNPQSHMTALGAFQNNNFSGDNLRAGVEWAFRDVFALRGSYFGTFNGTIDPLTGEETFKFAAGDDLYQGVAVGAGVKARFGDAGRLGVDFAWRPVRAFFDDVVEVGVRLQF